MSVQGDSAGPGAGGFGGRARAAGELRVAATQGQPAPETNRRPDLLVSGKARLSRIEKLQIAFIRKSFEPGRLDQSLRWGQRYVGSTWIHYFTRHLRHVHGVERLPELSTDRSFILVSNHRSFFDLYVVTAELVRRGLPHRILFPVRSNFFYDTPLGFFVNGVMSFFAMYPPIFRDRAKLALNVDSIGELVWLLRRGGSFAGMHPEGMRNLSDDPYTFLPAQAGIGRVIHEARVTVLPVFINGLINRLGRQVASNFDRTGTPIVVVFGPPVDFGTLIEERSSPRVHRAIAERTIEAIAELGREERAIRATMT
jgi:1-acyl-sn-glycerol-3-phosphate acyltransferase